MIVPTNETVTEWAIGVFNPAGELTSVTTHREYLASPFREEHTEKTARLDREAWVGEGGAWRRTPDRIRVVSRVITPWSPS